MPGDLKIWSLASVAASVVSLAERLFIFWLSDEHRPRRAYETTNKQNPRPTSVEQQPRGARAASYGEGAASGGHQLVPARGGHMCGMVSHFSGDGCAQRGAAWAQLCAVF